MFVDFKHSDIFHKAIQKKFSFTASSYDKIPHCGITVKPVSKIYIFLGFFLFACCADVHNIP